MNPAREALTRAVNRAIANGAPIIRGMPTIEAAAERLMRLLDAVNPRFTVAPGMQAQIDEAKAELRDALERRRG